MYAHSVVLARLFINNRRFWIPCMTLLCLCALSIFLQQPGNRIEISVSAQSTHDFPYVLTNSLTYDEVKLLLSQLFDTEIPLVEIQSIWNKIIHVWKEVLQKFIRNACDLCHQNDSYCYESIDLNRYIYFINESFYPIDDSRRPIGMGLYYYFDLKTLRSVNNSILPTDVLHCDYFHMIQLMINVQTILHEANIKYFLTKGTLIGVLRHHDVIPWDTDIDIFIPASGTEKILQSFRQVGPPIKILKKLPKKIMIRTTTTTATTTMTTKSTTKKRARNQSSFEKDLVVYRFRNIYGVISYKIFSLRSPLVNRTHYRWPKIDIFPYEENATHIYAYPKHRHNLGTMNYIAKSEIEPLYLRILGPLLIPSPRHLRLSLKAMIKLGRADVFYACEGNTFLHRYNRGPTDTWRVPCKILHETYPFVKYERNITSKLCFEELKFPNLNHSLSLYQYQCDEELKRTL